MIFKSFDRNAGNVKGANGKKNNLEKLDGNADYTVHDVGNYRFFEHLN